MTKRTPKPAKKLWLHGYTFGVDEAGPIKSLFLGLYVGDGDLSWYYAWFPETKTHAIDYALMNKKPLTHTIISGLQGVDVPFTFYSQPTDPIRIDQLAPADNRTQIGIALQKTDSFLVRFIIEYNKARDRHMFMVAYRGIAPKDLVGKVCWGRMVAVGDTPGSVPWDFKSHVSQQGSP
jgi:hypothetical protein